MEPRNTVKCVRPLHCESSVRDFLYYIKIFEPKGENKFGRNDTNEEEGIFPHINSMLIGRAGNRDADLAQEVYDDRE